MKGRRVPTFLGAYSQKDFKNKISQGFHVLVRQKKRMKKIGTIWTIVYCRTLMRTDPFSFYLNAYGSDIQAEVLVSLVIRTAKTPN